MDFNTFITAIQSQSYLRLVQEYVAIQASGGEDDKSMALMGIAKTIETVSGLFRAGKLSRGRRSPSSLGPGCSGLTGESQGNCSQLSGSCHTHH